MNNKNPQPTPNTDPINDDFQDNNVNDAVPDEEHSNHRHHHHRGKPSAKGKLPAQDLNKSLEDNENPYIISEESNLKKEKKTKILKKLRFIFICIIASLGLNLLSFQVPYSPSIVTIDFSPFPELLACMVVHPVAGVAVILIKNLLYYFIRPAASASLPNKIILDTVFILIVWAIYKIIINSNAIKRKNEMRESEGKSKKNYSPAAMTVSGLISSLITSVISVFTFRYVLLPMLLKQLGGDKYYYFIYNNYKEAYKTLVHRFTFIGNILPAFDSMRVGIIVYNIPLFSIKYFISAVLAVVLYHIIKE